MPPACPTVPRRLHFIWWQGLMRMPARLFINLQTWQALHPSWSLVVWDRPRILSLVAALPAAPYGQLARRALAAYRHDIQRVDFARLLILWAHGGVYSDLDLLPLRPVDALVLPVSFYICREHEPQLSFCNAFIAAAAGHPAIGLMIQGLLACQPLQDRPHGSDHARVLATTGPGAITAVVRALMRRPAPAVAIDMDPNSVYPAPWAMTELQAGVGAWAVRYPGSYAVHLWAGAWTALLSGAGAAGGEG